MSKQLHAFGGIKTRWQSKLRRQEKSGPRFLLKYYAQDSISTTVAILPASSALYAGNMAVRVIYIGLNM